jgi:hypothetical protein
MNLLFIDAPSNDGPDPDLENIIESLLAESKTIQSNILYILNNYLFYFSSIGK